MAVNRCAIALGSNLGDSLAILRGAIATLDQHSNVAVTQVSSVYQTAPVGGPPQPDILNACALLKSDLSPESLLRLLLLVETEFGRVRRERWGARLLDLDLLLVGEQQLKTPILELPHPRMWERAFVLVPLAEIAPQWCNPLSGQAIADIRATLSDDGITRLTDAQSWLKAP
ncbi:MAG: 2-amino-4-hydroxy-6-hydroxymethyldihydropteridine diphosphokinase [Leptolyngbya sp. SIOISBB]|nr:2-amino-4-hydroxy-6-hydroxymethyldihydropteridine diphosphokinase [Leptolyngbya sp. SIOISBB]